MLGEFEFYWNFKNENYLLGIVARYVVVQLLRKRLVLWPKVAVLLASNFQDLGFNFNFNFQMD